MKKSLKELLLELEKKSKNESYDPDLLLTKVQFFQHERLIHLIVTFFVGISCILFLIGFYLIDNLGFLLLFFLTLCLLIPYLFHYYTLENGVQKLYEYYFMIKKNKS